MSELEPPLTPLPRAFYERSTLDVARDLLGKLLVHRVDGLLSLGTGALIVGRIVETEAYLGLEDRASHASRGRTKRNAVMFGPPGHAYVYLIYGMYCCLNVVTESEGCPAAVLIRALEPIQGIDVPTDGPGKLCRATRIDRALDGADLVGPDLWIADAGSAHEPVLAGPRVGVDYAGDWATRPWRFQLGGNPHVSRRRLRPPSSSVIIQAGEKAP